MRPRKLARPEYLESRRLLAVDLLAPLGDLVVVRGTPPRTIDLGPLFDLAGVTGTLVRLKTNMPLPDATLHAELFDQSGPDRTRTTPLTVTNFLAYTDAGRYNNTIVHRSVPNFVIQAGGFAATESGTSLVESIEPFPALVNESGNTNARGTLAMAKLDGDPNSATNQFFVNLANNADNLDSANGGFTVFGRVLGNGMDLADAVAALPRYDYGTPFNELPTIGLTDPAAIARENVVLITSVTRVGDLVYRASTTAPALVAATVEAAEGLVLSFTSASTGTATITVRAASVFDAADFVEESFLVTVVNPAADEVNAIAGIDGSVLRVSRSAGNALVDDPDVPLPADGGWEAIVQGDFDGNGRGDVAMMSVGGKWWVALTPATGVAPTPTVWTNLRTDVPWRFPTVGDFTGEGRDDIAVFNPLSGAWRVLTSNGSAFDKATFGEWDPAGEWTKPLRGDFDGDGRADLASRDLRTGGWHVARSDGASFTTGIWRWQRKIIDWQSLTAADFDGDGRTDIATWNSKSGAWRVLTSTGTGFTNNWFTQWNPKVAWTDVVAGDFDGDGKHDLAARESTGSTVVVAISETTSFTTSSWGELDAVVTWQFVTSGDFNGDGKSDLAAWDAGTGAWRLLASNGLAFVAAAFGSWSTDVSWSHSYGLRV
ncbi:MAG: hypothetical protein FJ284_00135 [Planctomycetes bacterium]|nr:hypothetical protein [Planctomycetota bacterium]MBM4056995.1 hypothetical protein [Planctomycetota bacterium]